MDYLTWLIIIASVVAGVIGLMLVRRGFKGYPTDNHPLCGTCGFDLFGLPPDAIRCSECGVDVTIPGSTRMGHHRRRPRLILAGSVLLVPLLIVGTIFIGGTVANVAWVQYQPLWYLRRQAVSNPSGPATTEISRRIKLGTLSDAQLRSLVDQGLAIQADVAQAWNTAWGDWIEAARANKKVSDEQWKQYLSNAPAVRMVLRSEVRRGDGLPVRVESGKARVGSNARFWVNIGHEYPPDGVIIPTRSTSGSAIDANGGGSSMFTLQPDPKRLAATSDGPQTLNATLKLKIYETSNVTSSPPAATRDIAVSLPWTLLPADKPTVTSIQNPSLRPQVETAIRDVRLSMGSSPPPNQYVNVNLEFRNVPVAVAYKVILRADGKEWAAGSVYVRGNSSMGWGTSGQVNGLTADRVDVIFRPDAATAANTVDLGDYWDGEVIIKNVAIEWPPSPTTSFTARSSSPTPSKTSPANPGAPATQER